MALPLAMAVLAGAGVGANLLEYRHMQAISRLNIKREEKAAEMRAEDRRARLREALAAQRVAAITQGSDPDVGSPVTIRDQSVLSWQRESEQDAFQTAGNIASLKNARLTAAFQAIGGSSNALLSYYASSRETTGGGPG